MLSEDSRDRLLLMGYGVLILLAPVLILVLTLGFLSLSGEIVLSRLSLLEFLELYLIELLIVGGFGYGIYRLTLWAARHRVPALLNTLEAKDAVTLQNEHAPNDDESRE